MRRGLPPLVIVLVLLGAGTALLLTRGGGGETRGECAGARGGDEREREEREEREREERDGEGSRASGTSPQEALFAGPGEVEGGCGEVPGRPESFADLAKVNSSMVTRQVAPGTAIKPGAYRAAIRGRAELPTIGGAWTPYGKPPLVSYRQEFDEEGGSTRMGLGDLSGRANGLARDGAGTLYAAIANGGVWKSADGQSWTAIGETLPTQVVGAIAHTSAAGGRLLVLTGDRAFGGNTSAGLGAYLSADGGKTWQHATGIPDGLLGFRLAVDANDASTVYAATGGGLFRSTDGGASYENVNLPTGKNAPAPTPDCSGKPVTEKNCFLANVVTDVVVQGPANASTSGGRPGAVMAAVGWRAGTKPNADGAQQSPGNGIYTSPTGAPGSFTNAGFAQNSTPTTDPLTQSRIGRIALGAATGAAQDHRVVYAIVQDAVEFNGGVVGLDADEYGTTTPAQSEVLNGVWVSTNFGASWRQLEGSNAISNDTTSGSALAPPVCRAPAVVSYCPGVQAWFNLFVSPDPTRQAPNGVPTRLVFGLEEVWSNPGPERPTGLDGSAPVKFSVVGRYYAGETCTILNATNGLPICPAAPGGEVPKFTTHPDQHGALWVPDAGGGGVTLFIANDGGIYRQRVTAGGELSNDNWGQGRPEGRSGANDGLNTLQAYDFAMARDGTVYMGLQDNGEAKIEPDGSMYTIYGGDGFFTAVDPDDAKIAYEEYVAGEISVTKDGGRLWTDIRPSGLTGALFSTPFEMDRNDAKHLVIGGRNVFETTVGPATTSGSWAEVFDLGTQKHPGDASAAASDDDPINQLSAVDTLSVDAGVGAPTGPKTPDFTYTGGATTVPGPATSSELGVFPPGSYEDRPFKLAPDAGNAALHVKVTWADELNDWDLYLFRTEDGRDVELARSANGGTTEEEVAVANPPPGDYFVRVVNWAAAGTFDAAVTFDQRTEATIKQTATYVGFCGYCDTITQGTPFANGIATNVGGAKPAVAGKPDGWHIAKAAGLPSRYITSIRMDPANPRTVYVTLGGYARRWAFPGAVGEDTSRIGKGHVFKSTDAGETFTDVSGDLPDVPANWSVLHNGHLVVGTDIGVFESCDAAGGGYSRLGTGLPTTPVSSLRFKPGDPDLLAVATYGRGIYTYRFGADNARCPAPPGAPTAPAGAPAGPAPPAGPDSPACTARKGFKSVRVKPQGRGLRFVVERRVKAPFKVEVVQQAKGRRVLKKRLVKRFRNRTRSFTWKGSRRLSRGVYFTRVSLRKGKLLDVRRAAFTRKRNRFRRRPQFFARESCGLLRSVKLNGPSFGGRFERPLAVAFRLRRPGTVTVTYQQGNRRLLRRAVEVADGRYHRVRLPAAKARRGDVRVRIAARSGSVRRTVRLTGQRL